MDVAQLSVLRELAERGSITEVAHALHKSPSAVSQQLKTLQRQVGVALVERVGRGVRLTDAGKALAASSVKVATAMAEAEATWSAYRGGAAGPVRVAMFHSASELLVPRLISALDAHPGIRLDIADCDVSQDDFGGLTAENDIVVAHRSDDAAPSDRAALSVVELLREPLDVAVPLGHALAHRESISFGEVVSEPWIGVPEGYPIDRVLRTMAAHAGLPVHVAYRLTYLPLTEKLVATGHGVALLPRHTSRERAEGRFRLLPLVDVRAGRYVEALMRPDRAARRAVRIVLEELVAAAAASAD